MGMIVYIEYYIIEKDSLKLLGVQGHIPSLKGIYVVAGPPPEEKSSGSGLFILGVIECGIR
jgi:hypothetical protein